MEDNKVPLMVTIQCITYNHEPYIRQCLEGFVMQKTNFRFEAIVHDDASTDGTADIIREYAEKYPDIIKPIYETENQYSKHDGSLDRIMNDHTHGKYVALCEGDDYWIDPLKLQKQVDLLEKYSECSMCCSGYIRNQAGKKDIVRNILSEKGFFFFTGEDWAKQWMANPLTWVYRKEKMRECDAKLGVYKYFRDIHIIYHLLKTGNGIYLSEITAVYHLHPGGVCSSLSVLEKVRDSYKCYKELYLNNQDKVLRENYFNSIRARLMFGDKKRVLFQEGQGMSCSLRKRITLLLAFIIPTFVWTAFKKIK